MIRKQSSSNVLEHKKRMLPTLVDREQSKMLWTRATEEHTAYLRGAQIYFEGFKSGGDLWICL